MKKGVAQISDAVWAIGIFLLFFTFIFIPMSNWILDQYRASVAATQAKRVQQAVNTYIKDNHDTIAATATATNPFIFGVPQLISSGYLPTGFSPQNGFSATYQTRVFEPTANKLNSMTFLNGGVQLSKSLARKIAIGIGADGGIIDNGVAQGALGSWTMNLSSFGGYNPGEGSVVIAGFYDNGIKISDYLYRKAVPGHPELNTMSTSLNMGGNNISNAATTTTTNLNATTATVTDINATNVNSQTTRTVGETYTGGWFRTTGDTGWYSEKWGGGFHMTDSDWIRAYNNKSIYTAGQVQAGSIQSNGTIQSNGRMTTNEFVQINGVAIVGGTCSPNGLVGRDASGGILSCQSGVWKSTNFSLRVGATFQVWPGQTVNLGRFKLCINTYRIDGREMALTELIPTDAPDTNGNMNWRAMNATQYSSYYMGIHCFI
ncbi:shufflon system plasmid conjugative transfer pilus tip adhesin PilV [Salmonella enterica subsp. enterica serovar Enteritidis]|uniref:Shufflon system plasmid conjugative transfer pilus tip adhesin PilV n=5 Tax=Salmonella enterica TaxID=28901 RepID=A0A5U9NYJ5_SALMU|nr:shufflon system plasmid conjugative transfer pilus tip adhesin PilV [Salmonella enterica]EAA1730946.1 shufflon system plasmid conjugative transfer pilus tip adhesin PilV [Salmonella enterica subsp. enterica serovar Oranienburg]EAA1754440.1 shufflon system plasmid conjugative transfer pilus tip adhesin PilV [Salmonella enterica subsp. enterica serovar Sundsvall]EAA2694829.1 shufflon system plasmid conjugative transfer pilus tip adhesin PilV [Salmonella enterica subsp. enterica serovar Typhimur